MTIDVSIVLPTYNQAHFLPQALDGVFAQTYTNYELIVVNDGSQDDTEGVLAKYQSDHTFRVVHQENQGLPRALNTGFALARGRYLTWTSSDNIMLPDMLGVLASALDQDSSIGLVYADFYLMNEEGANLDLFRTFEYKPYWLTYANLVYCCFMYRRACMERVGGYDPEFIYGEDWEYWIRISQYFRMKRVPQALYRYRLHTASMTSEIVKGTAKKLSHAEFTDRIKRRMPLRWFVHRMIRRGLRMSGSNHPLFSMDGYWTDMIAQAAEKHEVRV